MRGRRTPGRRAGGGSEREQVTIVLTGHALTLAEMVRVARHAERVEIDPAALAAMGQMRAVVEHALARGDEVYGLTTGVGPAKSFRIDPRKMREFNRMMVSGSAVGQGPDAPEEIIRATLLRLANGFVSGIPAFVPSSPSGSSTR